MNGMIRFRLDSLAAKLGLVGLIGFVTPALLTGLLLLTAWGASEVVGTARQAHERVSVYMQLERAAGTYQRLSYQLSANTSEEARRKVAEARTRFYNLLSEAQRLPASNARERHVRELIDKQGSLALAHYENAEEHVANVDRAWREGGSRAALLEVNRMSKPINDLEEMLQSEIRRGDWMTAQDTSDAQELIDTAMIAGLIGLLTAGLFFALMQILLRRRLLPGLKRLEEGARAFGTGDLAFRSELAGKDELARLSAAFDLMAQTISEKQDALNEVREGLELSVATATRELREANAELSAADERRRAFLADIGHELRTPLTVIRGEAQVAIRLVDREDFDCSEYFERILNQTQDLSRMVEDLFLIARAQAGGLAMNMEMLDLTQIAADAAGDFDALANITGSSIEAKSAAPVFARVDKNRVRRALAALIENALRHCQGGVVIVIEVWREDDRACMAVTDDGPGIDFEHSEELFQRFHRGRTQVEGSGLGLSLVHALAVAHGGSAELLPAPGTGTRAVLKFDASPCQQEAA